MEKLALLEVPNPQLPGHEGNTPVLMVFSEFAGTPTESYATSILDALN
jgi:hypothetical protein